jgi:hypothetical protein
VTVGALNGFRDGSYEMILSDGSKTTKPREAVRQIKGQKKPRDV